MKLDFIKLSGTQRRNLSMLIVGLLSLYGLGFTQRVEFIKDILEYEVGGISIITITSLLGIIIIYWIYKKKI